MLLISAGMQKAGSAYLFNILNDILIEASWNDVRAIREKHNLSHILREHNCNAGSLTWPKMLRLLSYSHTEGPYVVKTHAGPSRSVLLLMRMGLVKAVYIYRDPRDVILSAMDHGNRILAEGKQHTFAKMASFEKAFPAVKQWVANWEAWTRCGRACLVRYEDLMAEPVPTLRRVMSYLKMSLEEPVLEKILDKYDKNRLQDKNTRNALHLNKAIVNRYRDEMPEEQLRIFQKEIGHTLLRMGYPDF